VNRATCIFCDILAGRAEATFVYRDALCAAFMDIRPVNPGHVLVVPVRHAEGLSATRPDEWKGITDLGKRIAAALRASDLKCEGVNLFLADGESAGQEVFHAHLHVLPRFQGDEFGLRFPESYGHLPSRDALEETADRIRSRLDFRKWGEAL
jgi:diadenosine tetraphosphate (Ap4A) HIT family hydrolase